MKELINLSAIYAITSHDSKKPTTSWTKTYSSLIPMMLVYMIGDIYINTVTVYLTMQEFTIMTLMTHDYSVQQCLESIKENNPRLYIRADSRFAHSQWETALLCNDVSHWLGANLDSVQYIVTRIVHIFTNTYNISITRLCKCISPVSQCLILPYSILFSHFHKIGRSSCYWNAPLSVTSC